MIMMTTIGTKKGAEGSSMDTFVAREERKWLNAEHWESFSLLLPLFVSHVWVFVRRRPCATACICIILHHGSKAKHRACMEARRKKPVTIRVVLK